MLSLWQLLNSAGHAPEIYTTFNNGIAYKYIRGETLTPATVRDPNVYRLVAKMMAKFHRLNVNERCGTMESGLWNKLKQLAGLIPERYKLPATDLRLVPFYIKTVNMRLLYLFFWYVIKKNLKPIIYRKFNRLN